MGIVKAWRDKIIIPTYEIGGAEKYPVFLENRVYQGSSGVVYPHPVIEKISDKKINKEWDVIYIENDFLKIMVLPELGGRIQMAYDKIQKRHFVYYNHVIKPALVGLTGPWISGGIEFNWPQHHRPSTYDAVDFYIEENKDGSKTVWVSEVERMFRTKGMAGFTLHPDKAYLEIKAKLYNRTAHSQTFLWWANPAVAVNDDYQSVFPPDVNAVFDHGKRDVSEFPIAKGEYYKVDYSPGTDISKYKNIPVPTSYMAITSKYDFVGGYENDSKGGLLHVADHQVSPGKKQWTWGNGDFGRAWDRNLTDKDGPYIELMCGVYTDNQPDFSWMHPYEEKTFTQYFMPYYNVGVVKNANKNALVNLELNNGKALVKFHVTSVYAGCTIQLICNGVVVLNEIKDLSPQQGFQHTVEVGKVPYEQLEVILSDKRGKKIISWKPDVRNENEIPEPAKEVKDPSEIDSVGQLYLNGLHLEQYRHATYDPTDYYKEALKRDPKHVSSNNAMGKWLLKKGKFKEALNYFNIAIETLTERNPNPYDGEPFFNKGLTLKLLGEQDGAYNAFYKSCWNAPWQDAGYFNVAQIDCERGDYDRSLEHIDRALIRNWHNHKARHLKIALLRKLDKIAEAKILIKDSLEIDKFNFGALFEKYLISKTEENLSNFEQRIRGYAHNYIEFSLDYAQAGLYEEAIAMIELCVKGNEVYPMIYYFIGWYYCKNGKYEKGETLFKKARQMPKDYCFPNRLEEVVVLQYITKNYPNDAEANYYLGNFWYANRQYQDAQKCWNRSMQLDPKNPICIRNLGLYYYNNAAQKDKAIKLLEKSFELDNKNARVLMELDQLYKKMNVSIDERLNLLESNLSLTLSRDDLYLERVALYNIKGDYHEALRLINQWQFHPWEGGEGRVPFHYIMANVEIAKELISDKKFQKAIEYLEAAQVFPNNLGEGKLIGAQENDINYWLGCAYEGLDNYGKANEFWYKASKGLAVLSSAIFYNDQQPDKIFYQGLALLKLADIKGALIMFNNLLEYGKTHLNDEVKIDYFAISLPDLLIWDEDLNVRNKIHCNYLIGLGYLGLSQFGNSISAFMRVKDKDLYHLPGRIHLKMTKDLNLI